MTVKEVDIKPEVNEELVFMLSKALEMAKSGELQSAALATWFSDGKSGNCFTGYMPLALIGELRVMERDIIDCNVTTRRNPIWDE